MTNCIDSQWLLDALNDAAETLAQAIDRIESDPRRAAGVLEHEIPELYAKLLAFKSTMDLHTNIFGQMVLAQYLLDNDLDAQIEKIKDMYREKAEKMMACMAEDFPAEVSYTKPEGGMFIWATMPEGLKAVTYDIHNGVIEVEGERYPSLSGSLYLGLTGGIGVRYDGSDGREPFFAYTQV